MKRIRGQLVFIALLQALILYDVSGLDLSGLRDGDPETICAQALHSTGNAIVGTTTDGASTEGSSSPPPASSPAASGPVVDGAADLQHARFFISVNHTKYIPGQTLAVTVCGSIPYRGILLQARRVAMNTVIGTFLLPQLQQPDTDNDDIFVDVDNDDSQDGTTRRAGKDGGRQTDKDGGRQTDKDGGRPEDSEVRSINCDSDSDTLVAWYRNPVINQTFLWKPPDEETELLQFTGTVFMTENTHLPNVTSKIFRKGFFSIDLSGCGHTKGCVRYCARDVASQDCTQDTSEYLLTYRARGSEAEFEMSAMADWVAVGFSSDDRMGGDDVFMCARNHWTVTVSRYVSEMGHQTPIQREANPFYDIQGEVGTDDRISCRFKRPLKVVYQADQFSVDLSNNWYQLYAWGALSPSGVLLRHTLDRPPTSTEKRTLKANRNEFMTNGARSGLRSNQYNSLSSSSLVATAAAAAVFRLMLSLFQRHQPPPTLAFQFRR